MKNELTMNYCFFVRKLAIIQYLYYNCNFEFKEIAWVVDSREEVIQLYCKKLL